MFNLVKQTFLYKFLGLVYEEKIGRVKNIVGFKSYHLGDVFL